MLSFDITDRNIRVVKGTESNGKIKISSAATLNVEENLIVNGHVKDVPNVATLINGVLKKHKIPDKEAIVSISSNLTIFKEMNVAKVKNQDLQKVVKQQMQAELNLDDSYSVSYIIVGETEGSGEGEAAYKILATACPYEIVNSYREVFKLLSISLRSVMIGCNCITKVLLADTKIKSKMPLLAVQIDNNFISLNLYEQGSLSFSRFASIDAADYGYSDDYVFEAVNENIFRMLQFHRSRNTGEAIENVIFYGDTHEYVRLTDELEKLDLKTSLINVPPQIHGHENLEFSLYANAIGAMFKRNRETEKINLLETDLGTVVKNKIKNDSSGDVVLVACLAASLLITGGIFGFTAMKNKGIEKDIKSCQDFLDSQDTADKLALVDALDLKKNQVDAYYNKVNNAKVAYLSRPIIERSKYDNIKGVMVNLSKDKKYKDFMNGGIVTFESYTEGNMNINWKIYLPDNKKVDEKMTQDIPAVYVTNLLKVQDWEKKPMFRKAAYSGYTVTKGSENEESKEKEPDYFEFSLSLEFNSYQNPATDMLEAEKEGAQS